MVENELRAGHIYTVELRFSGDQLDPSDVSARLKVPASNTSDRPMVELAGRRRRPFWSYNGIDQAGFQADWESLDVGLKFLLGCLSDRKEEINWLAKQFNGRWWCGHFQSSFDGGPTLSPELLTEISAYGLPLTIDNYFSGESA